MSYLKSLFFNFLIVFFANHVLPGITVIDQTKLPHLGGDLLFAIILGFLNSLIYPILRLVRKQQTVLQIAMFAIVLNFASYACVKFLFSGIHVASVEGYFFASLFVTLGSFLTNYFEMRHFRQKPPKSSIEPPSKPLS